MSAYNWANQAVWANGDTWAQGVGELLDIDGAPITVAPAIGAGQVLDVPVLAGEPIIITPTLPAGAVVDEGGTTPTPDGWPTHGVRLLVPLAGPDPIPVKVVHQYDLERIVYVLDFDAKFLTQVGDTATTLAAFTKPAYLPAAPRVAVGGALADGRVMFSVGPAAPEGVHEIVVAIDTQGGNRRACVVQVTVREP